MRNVLFVAMLFLVSTAALFAQEDNTRYEDLTIGNVAQFLVPTYPTIQLPNQMLRMFPMKKNYLFGKSLLCRIKTIKID